MLGETKDRPRVGQEHRGVQDECRTGDAGTGGRVRCGRTGPLPRGSGSARPARWPSFPGPSRRRSVLLWRLSHGGGVLDSGWRHGGWSWSQGCSGGRAPSVRSPRRPGPRRGRVRPHPWSGLGDREIPGHTQTLTGRGTSRPAPERADVSQQRQDQQVYAGPGRVRWCARPRRARRCRPRPCAAARAGSDRPDLRDRARPQYAARPRRRPRRPRRRPNWRPSLASMAASHGRGLVGRAHRYIRSEHLRPCVGRRCQHGCDRGLQLAPTPVPAGPVAVEVALPVAVPEPQPIAELPVHPTGGVAGPGEQQDQHHREDLVHASPCWLARHHDGEARPFPQGLTEIGGIR